MKTTNTIGIITATCMVALFAAVAIQPSHDYDVAGHQAIIESLQEPEPVVLYTVEEIDAENARNAKKPAELIRKQQLELGLPVYPPAGDKSVKELFAANYIKSGR